MMNSLFRFLVVVIMTITAAVLVNGQEANSITEPSGKVIEVHSSRSPRPSLIALGRDRSSGFWASFPRLKDWKPTSAADPIQVIDFKARLVGDQGELVISGLSGKRFGENTEIIARIMLSVGDTVVISEMKKFGFEPVTVKMLQIATAIADVPLVSNPAPLLRTKVSNVVATLPTFNIKFVNESSKDIMAFAWHTQAGEHMLLTSTAQGKYGEPLMAANGSFEMNISAENHDTGSPYVTMVIRAVIYADGSIDGDPKEALSFLAYTEGRKKALEQLVPIFRKAADKSSRRPDIPSLISAVDAISDGGPQVNGRPSSPAGIAFAGVIKEALESLRRLNSESMEDGVETQRKLAELSDFYRDWQIRMQK